MDFTMKSLSLYAAVTLTGLSAGLFYAWAVSVIPGTQRVIDTTYLEATPLDILKNGSILSVGNLS